MTTDTRLKVGSVVQITPHGKHGGFGGQFLVVSEMKDWGVMGYVQCFHETDLRQMGGQAYYRIAFEDIAYIGQTEWIVDGTLDGESERGE